jgi:hypothetical protein
MGKRGLIRAANSLDEAESILFEAGFHDFVQVDNMNEG